LLKRESGPAPSVGERELGDRVVAFWPVFGPPSEHEPLTPLGDDHDPAQRIVVERERTPDLRGDLRGGPGELGMLARVDQRIVNVVRLRLHRHRLPEILHCHGFHSSLWTSRGTESPWSKASWGRIGP